MAEGSALFFGVGVDHYDSELGTLDHPIADITDVRRLLVGFEGDPLCDPIEDDVRARLRTIKGHFPDNDGVLVAMWSGHGLAPGQKTSLRLIARNSDPDQTGGFSPNDVLGPCALSGANQLLFIVDTCFAGAAVDAGAIAAELFASVSTSDVRPPWVGVLASCSADVTARDGVFARQLKRLLADGPTDPDLRRRWSAHSPRVRGDDLCDALLKEWPGAESQQPVYQSNGSAWFMVRNPLWRENAPPQVVEHLLLAARSGKDPRSWFTGRTSEVDRVVGWVRERRPGVHVVTGSAGTGKSAVLGRVVSASVPAERKRLLEQGPLGHADPGRGSVVAHAHARGLTANRLAEVLNTGLEDADFLERTERGRPNANLLLGAVEQAAATWPAGEPPVLAVDGLDEARSEAFDIARDLLARLAEWVTVVVSTRNLPGEGDGPDLIRSLGPVAGLLDLNEAAAAQSGRQAMWSYINNRLHGVARSMDPELVADEFLRRTAATSGEPFLIARLLTDQLREDPVDTASDGWQPRVVTSLTSAFELNLAMLEPPRHRIEVDSARLGRELLAALTWAFGAGFPEDEWLCVAQALSNLEPPVDRDDISWLLNQLGRFIIQDGEGGVAVYRLAHQSIADLLRADSKDEPYRAMAQAITTKLLDRYRMLLIAGMPAERPVYLWRYAWRHAVQAGEAGFEMLRKLGAESPSLQADVALAAHSLSTELAENRNFVASLTFNREAVDSYRTLVAEHPVLLPQLAAALTDLGVRYSQLGRWHQAMSPTEEAVQMYRALTSGNPAFAPYLGGALINLGTRYSEMGQRQQAMAPTEEAVRIYRTLAAENSAFLPYLGMALNNIAGRYSQLGQRRQALATMQEAVEIYRRLAASNPAILPDLGMALSNFGISYSEMGQREQAMGPTEEAVRIYRGLAADNLAFLPGLAMALNNLGYRYSDWGRLQKAMLATDEAVQIYRELAAANPAFLPDLAMTLNNLGISYSETGQRQQAMEPTEEAIRIYRDLVADSPAFIPDLASALSNLGARYGENNQRQEAMAPTEEAVRIYRDLAADNPAFIPDLASALNNLGARYGENNQRQEAMAPTEEAVRIYRDLAADNPAFLPGLASALGNLGIWYSGTGRWQEALASTESVVQSYRELTASNSAFLPDLATALNNLSIGYSEVGQLQQAIAPAEESVQIRRRLTKDNPGLLHDLAAALKNLSIVRNGTGQSQQAIAPAEESVQIRRRLAADNPAFLPELASSLNNVRIIYNHLGRWQEALASAKEVVQLLQALAAETRTYLPELVSALVNHEHNLEELGRQGESELAWQQALNALPDSAATLLYFRAAQAPLDDARAIEWLVGSLAKPNLGSGLERAIHEAAHSRRASDPAAFDARWSAATGNSVAAWLMIDAECLEAATGWVDAPTFRQEASWLVDHPELLDPASDGAVAEALLGLEEDEAERLRNLRNVAQADGVSAAYQSLLDAELLGRFFSADLAEQAKLLDTEGERLRRPNFLTSLSELITQDDQDLVPLALRAQALILLSATDSHRAAIDALIDQAEFDLLLHAAAVNGRVEKLSALATLLMAEATNDNQYALVLFYQAIAGLLNDVPPDQFRELVHTLRRGAEAAEYINLAASMGAEQPKALAIIPLLTEPLPAEGDDGQA